MLCLAADKINPVSWDSQHQPSAISRYRTTDMYVYIQQIQHSVQAAIAKPLVWRSVRRVSASQNYYVHMSYCTITLSHTKWRSSSPGGEEGFSFVFLICF